MVQWKFLVSCLTFWSVGWSIGLNPIYLVDPSVGLNLGSEHALAAALVKSIYDTQRQIPCTVLVHKGMIQRISQGQHGWHDGAFSALMLGRYSVRISQDSLLRKNSLSVPLVGPSFSLRRSVKMRNCAFAHPTTSIGYEIISLKLWVTGFYLMLLQTSVAVLILRQFCHSISRHHPWICITFTSLVPFSLVISHTNDKLSYYPSWFCWRHFWA